ncbi:MAG: gliding motility-associated C-terminal domain-containing protein, partial [Chitinophagales bacterium]|nr:gliding motility-associated C-terminal domain-containing protein [Chitinophagales bacterium]
IYIADQWNNMVRKLSTAGIVSTLAGSGAGGWADGPGATAQFNRPSGIALDRFNNIFIGDNLNNCVRKVAPNGDVTTFAGSTTPGYANGPAATALFNGPHGIIIDTFGTLYLGESYNPIVRKISSSGIVSTYAGTGVAGHLDGPLLSAQFKSVGDLISDKSGVVYLTDCVDNRIRKITNFYVMLGSDSNICLGTSVKINLTTNATSVLWNTGDTTKSITVSPVANTMYIATGTLNGNTLKDTMLINVYTYPTMSLGKDTFMCKGAGITLKATTNASTISWSNGAGVANINVFPATTTTYIATGTNVVCSKRDTIIVAVKNPPIVNPIADKVLCIVDSVNLISSNGLNYVWSPNYNISALNIAAPKVWPRVNTNYFVSIIDSFNCISKDTVFIKVDSCIKVKAKFSSSDTNVCLGNFLTFSNLSVTKPLATYQWSFGTGALPSASINKNPPAVVFNQIGNNIVRLIVTDSSGVDSFKMNIHISSVKANAGRDTSLCTDTLIYQLGESPIAKRSYLWTPSAGLSNPNIANPNLHTNASGKYILRVIDSTFSCTAYDTVDIAIVYRKKLDFSIIDSTLCWGDVGEYNYINPALPGSIFNWSFSGNTSHSSHIGTTPPQILYYNTGVFNVQLIRQDGCGTDSITKKVYVKTIIIDAGRDTALCGDTLIYQLGESPKAKHGYLWTPTMGLSNPNISNPILNTNTSRKYVLRVLDSVEGCTAYDTVDVSIQYKQKLNFSILDSTLCAGVAAQFTYTDSIPFGSAFTWDFGAMANPPSFIGANPPLINYTDTGFFNIQLKRQYACGIDSIIKSIYVEPKTQVQAGRDTALCADSIIYSLGASPNPNYTYQWTPISGLSNPMVSNPILNTKVGNRYIVSATSIIAGCVSRDTIDILLSNKRAFSIRVQDSTLCITAPAIISCPDSLNAGTSLNWSFGIGASISTFSGKIVPPVSFNDTGIHWIKLVKVDFCNTDSLFKKITVAPIPKVFAGIDTTVCADKLIRNIGEPGVSMYSYSWTPSTGLSNPNISNPVLTIGKSANYALTATNKEYECANSDAVLYTVHPLPKLSIAGDSIICDSQSILLKAISNYPVRWNGGGLGDTIRAKTKALYKVETASGVCLDIADSIFVNQYATPYLFFDSVIIAKKDESRNIALNTNALAINWNPFIDLFCADCKNQVVNVKSNRTYMITAVNGECSVKKLLEVILKTELCDKIGIPTGFSPNQDGVNDVFRIKYPCRFAFFEMKVYNRWGELVFESTNPDFSWDGTYKGVAQPIGLFVYNLSFRLDGASTTNRNGNVTLIR